MTTFTREDFEHAARAAGLRVRTWDGHTGTMCAIDDDRHGQMWMPPDDDGDALRLAVKLGLGILTKVNNAAHVAERCLGVCDIHQVNYGAAGDEFAATRHAIFRAAIEMGRAMQ